MHEPERISGDDDTLLACHAESMLRLGFVQSYCAGKRVLDAGCGSGYASHWLASNGAKEVLGIDVSVEAIAEATRAYQRGNLGFLCADVCDFTRQWAFDTIVNLETLAHLPEPTRFIDCARESLNPASGTLIISTPNGSQVELGDDGRPVYKYAHHAITSDDLRDMLQPCFARVELYGQWLTHQGKLRKLRAREQHELACDAYFNPMAQLGRGIKRALGKHVAPPPVNHSESDAYPGDYEVAPLVLGHFPWEPTTLIAVCRTAE